jgi:hypothetical protein
MAARNPCIIFANGLVRLDSLLSNDRGWKLDYYIKKTEAYF